MKISAQLQISLKATSSEMTDLHSVYIPLQHLFLWKLLRMAQLQQFLRQAQSLRLHSADLASVQAIHPQTMRSVSGIQQETSLTVKVLRFRTVRLHLLHLWMQDRLLQQQLIRVFLHLQQSLTESSRNTNITLTVRFIRTVYLIHTELLTAMLSFSLGPTLRTGRRWKHLLRIWCSELYQRYMIL